jgi:protein-S-isoprenylcysteine O-methyltransferase Ste14
MVGFLLVRPNYISLTMLMLELAATGYRIDGEERALADRFGDAHAAYRARTRRFIPFLY